MKTMLALLVVLPVMAQQPAASTATTNAASPVPSTEPMLTGWIDLGYRLENRNGRKL